MVVDQPVECGDDLRRRRKAIVAIEHFHHDEIHARGHANWRDNSARADDACDVASMAMVVGRGSGFRLRGLPIRTAARAVAVPAVAVLVDDASDEIRMGLINSGIEDGDRHSAAGVAEDVDFVGANEGDALRERPGASNVRIDAQHHWVRFNAPNRIAIDLRRERGDVAPLRNQIIFGGRKLIEDGLLSRCDRCNFPARRLEGDDDQHSDDHDWMLSRFDCDRSVCRPQPQLSAAAAVDRAPQRVMARLRRRHRQIGCDSAVRSRRVDSRGDGLRHGDGNPAVRGLQPDRLTGIDFGQLRANRAVRRLGINVAAAARELDVTVRSRDPM